jgi:hypothetical protein
MKAIKLHLAVVGAGVMFAQGARATTVSISLRALTRGATDDKRLSVG